MGESSIDTNLALLTSSPVMLSGAKLSGDMPLLLGSHGKLSMSQKVVPSSSHGSSIDEEEEEESEDVEYLAVSYYNFWIIGFYNGG